MERADTSDIRRRLEEDDLSCLITFLQNHHNKVVIAGSYTFAIHPDEKHDPSLGPGDIDIWIPWSSNNESSKILGDLLKCIIGSGYSDIKSRHQNPDNPNLSDDYMRMNHMIDTIYTVTRPDEIRPYRKVQILLLQEAGGTNPKDLIQHFDLNISRQYYDGWYIYRPSEVENDIRKNRITLNTASDVIRKQSFPEWVRTMRRIHKYTMKGFIVHKSVVSDLYDLVPVAMTAWCKWGRISSSYSGRTSFSYSLNTMGYFQEWNQLAKSHPLIPSIAFTVIPPGRYISDVRLVLCENPILPDYPEHERVVCYFSKSESHLTKHYNSLLDHERKTLVKPTGETGQHKSIYLHRCANKVHVSSLVPYPNLVVPDRVCTSLPRICWDTLMMEHVDIIEYLRAGENSDTGEQVHFVWYFQPQEGNMRAYGISWAMIENAQNFIPCVDIDHEWNAWSEMGSLVTLGVEPGLSFNLPKAQLMSMLNPPIGHTRHLYKIVSTEFSWDRSRRLHVTYEQFEGGFANNCQDDTSRTISFLEHVLCCTDEDWFTSVPVQRVTEHRQLYI